MIDITLEITPRMLKDAQGNEKKALVGHLGTHFDMPKDQYCADRGVFIVKNLCNLGALLALNNHFTVFTFPMNYAEMSGLPCRVLVKADEVQPQIY